MARRGSAPKTGLQRQLGDAKASLRVADRATSRLLTLLKRANVKLTATEKARRLLVSEDKTARKSKGRRGKRASAGQLAQAKARVVAAKGEAARVTRELGEVKREVRRLRAVLARLQRSVGSEKVFLTRVRQKENQRHRQIHRRLDVEAMNKQLPPELQSEEPAAPAARTYPRPELVLVSWWVCEWMRLHLEAAAAQIGGQAFVYRYEETMSVDGRLLFRKPDDMEIGELIASIADVLRPMQCGLTPLFGEARGMDERRSSLYYHETFFQAAITIYTQNHGFSSPGDRSRVLPGGIIESEFDGHWTSESADQALQALEAIYLNLVEAGTEREEEFEMGLLEVRFHWNPEGERPERSRAAPDRSVC
jgi:hypothetical protein